MATFDYAARGDDDGAPLLTEFGVSSTLTVWTKGAYNAASGAFAAGTTATHVVTAVVADYDQREIDRGLVQRDDKQVIIGGDSQAPTLNDKITIPTGGTKYEIISINPITPDRTTVVAYFLQVRK